MVTKNKVAPNITCSIGDYVTWLGKTGSRIHQGFVVFFSPRNTPLPEVYHDIDKRYNPINTKFDRYVVDCGPYLREMSGKVMVEYEVVAANNKTLQVIDPFDTDEELLDIYNVKLRVGTTRHQKQYALSPNQRGNKLT